jgi:hypothetical protein
MRRTTILIVKAIGIVAAATFWLSRLTTNIGIFLFVASIVVGGLCLVALSYLDDDFPKGRADGGYWPSKPFDWGAARTDSEAEKPTDSKPIR